MIASWHLSRLIALILCWNEVRCSSPILDSLYEGYNRNLRPPGEQATMVNVDIYVLSLSAISELTMDFIVNMYIRQRWQDTRLSHNESAPIQITNKLHETWLPDLFIRNDKVSTISDVTVPNKFARVDKDGSIVYSQRVTSTISCPMTLTHYPFDIQCCRIDFESYGQTTEELIFKWSNKAAVELDKGIQLPEHIIDGSYQSECSETYNSTGSYSCVYVTFELRRNVNYYVMSLFVPSVLIVVLSWVAFWIDKDSTPGRVSLSLLTILTMQTQLSSTLSQLPKVSYIKMIDVWLTGCLGFVFAGFLEYALVNKLATQERHIRQQRALLEKYNISSLILKPRLDEEESNGLIKLEPIQSQPNATKRSESIQNSSDKRMANSDRVDFLSRFLFPFSFLVFNVILWTRYLLDDRTCKVS